MADGRGLIMALDLGRSTGFCAGRPNTVPRSASVVLANPNKPRHVVFGNLADFLDKEFRHEKPDLLVKEAPLALEAFKQLGMGEPVVRMTFGLHGVAEALCARWGVKCEEAADSTVRKHFIGKGRLGDREATKRAVVGRCWQLGYFKRDTYDEDRGDACAVWDWACATLARVAPKELHMFQEGQGPT